MPGRQSTGPPSLSKPKSKRHKAKRSLNALAIAEKQTPERKKIRQNRLGESEEQHQAKRRHDEDEDGESAEEEPRKRPRKAATQGDNRDVEMGSDSSGNEWMIGQVDEDDDSDLDSDEAMGESDEERFEGYTFRGSTSRQPDKRKIKLGSRNREEGIENDDIDLAEHEEGSGGGDQEDDDFGEEGVDLAAVLDGSEGDSGSDHEDTGGTKGDQSSQSDDDMSSNDKASELSFSEDETDAKDTYKLRSLQDMVSTLITKNNQSSRHRSPDALESMTPSEFGLKSKRKLTIEDLAPTITNPEMQKSLRMMAGGTKKSTNKNGGIPGKLDVPLPKRQQDRLDRTAAYEKSKEALGRWIDTVKHNRRAEHLSFPLKDPSAVNAPGQNRLLPNGESKPMTDLEGTIQGILRESGLAPENGRSEEDQLQAFEQLKANKMPIEEVLARRADLRRQRELLFREEIRAKRIKKIKSKTYRKVHRKERERNAEHVKNALAAAGEDDSESEKERNDRRRAEERMGARHRESKWAKGIKDSGRAKWDDSAREGVIEMARRGEELKRRVEGKYVRDEDGSDFSFEASEDELSEGDVEAQERLLLDRLGDMGADDKEADSQENRLGNMEFMKKAEAHRKAANDADAESLRRDLAGEDTPSEHEGSETLGRKSYGPRKEQKDSFRTTPRVEKNEFEEREESDEDVLKSRRPKDVDIDRVVIDAGHGSTVGSSKPLQEQKSRTKPLRSSTSHALEPLKSSKNGQAASKSKGNDTVENSTSLKAPRSALKGSRAAEKARIKTSRPELNLEVASKKTLEVAQISDNDENGDDDDGEDDAPTQPITLSNAELARRAFAGDDVLDTTFQEEKAELTKEQDDQIIDTTMPGWGTWVGEGIGKKASRPRKQHRKITKVTGIAPENRKDAKLKDVIISEKRVKKNARYLASQLPHPFESRAQYERSLRLPIGPEWSTKETFQGLTKPRVLMKQGIIAPIARPVI